MMIEYFVKYFYALNHFSLRRIVIKTPFMIAGMILLCEKTDLQNMIAGPFLFAKDAVKHSFDFVEHANRQEQQSADAPQ